MSNAFKISTNYVNDILDEIALEGLDGITIEALWMRLSVRQNFCLKIDDNSKKFLWNIIIHLNDVQFYELPEPRASLLIYDYSSTTECHSAALELDKVYPYASIKNIPGVFGSCQHYFTRTEVTVEVIKKSLAEVMEKWGNKLVMVASQESRSSALLGNLCTPNIDFSKSPIQYDILERIGRCRHFGLATCGKGSLQSVVEDSKSIFHYLKFLYHHKLIKKQSLFGSLHTYANASKVFLSRFFEESLNENMVILQTAIEELKTRPNFMMPCEEFYALFGPEKKSRIKKYKKTSVFKKYITLTQNLPYRTFFPNASPSEWERKSKNGERVVRCFQLINPDVELAEILEKDCDPDDEETSPGLLPKGIYYKNVPIVAQAYHHIKNSGALGVTHVDLASKMGLNKIFIRGLIKRLVSEKYCTFYIENDGRRRSKRYLVGENSQTKAAASEIAQILSENTNVHVKNDTSENQTKELENSENKSNIANEKINLPQLQEENMSYRTLRRIGIIIKTIKFYRFRLFYQIAKCVNEEEIKEGLTSRADRVTLNRILQKLEKDELIKIITLTGKDKVGHTVKLYTDPTFEPDEKLAETLYHTNSSYNSSDTMKAPNEGQINLENEFSNVLLENLAEMKKMLDGVKRKPEKLPQEGSKESELVYSPKFIRLNIIHDFLFHLVYDYTGVVNKSQEELLEELCKTTAVDDDLKKEMPTLYGTQLSTYMFVPPLTNSGKMPGWFLISDLLIRLPLSVIVKIMRVGETCPELWRYLHHPIRKHFLVKDLPLSVRQIFFNRKHQIGSLYYDLRRLCFIGLLQFGLKFGREHYQTFVYLNKRASLLDTSTSPAEYYQVPSEMSFEVKPYLFNTKNDVKRYWMDMFNICMATNLGVKTNMIGKEILAERELGKESLKKLLEPKTIEKVVEDDNGTLPGDNLGAAGLDSVMFSFLRSNWTGPINKSKDQMREKKVIKIPLQKIKRDQVKRSRFLLKKTRRKKFSIKTEKSDSSILEEKPKTGRIRKIKEREFRFKRRRKTSYDEIDMEALKLMNTLRVTWSTAEDNLLLICRVAMMFLCPNSRTFVRIPWVEVRRVLQQNLPESRNKTQKAIARRIIYMLKNPTTVRSVNLCLEELKEMPEAVIRFDCSDLLNCIKPSAPNLTELQNSLYEKFHELVSFLKDRFIDNTNFNVKKRDKDLIPDSLEEFLETFQCEAAPEIQLNVKIIRESVIRAILTSSLSCRADKTSSAVQLFDIYRQYDDDELQNAIRKLHTDKVITISRKAGSSIFKTGKYLPLSFTPYKLSFAFQHMLNMKYTQSVYPESFSQINRLLQWNVSEDFDVDLNESNISLFLLAIKGFIVFKTILPDQIIALDSGDLSDSTYSKMLERYCEMLKFSSSNSKVVCTSGKIITRSEDDETVEVGETRKRSLPESDTVPSRKKAKNEDDDDEEEDRLSKKDESTCGNVSEETNKKEEEKSSGNENDHSFSEKTTRSSRVILYMMREEAKKDPKNDSGKLAQEFCVVNASKVLSVIDKTGLKSYTMEMEPKVVSTVTKNIISRSMVPINLVDENSVAESFKEVDNVDSLKFILELITSRKELGATNEELRCKCDSEILRKVLKHLIGTKIVIKSGIEETRYISQKYCTPWLLNSFKMTRLEREKVKPNELTAVELTGGPGSNESNVEEHPKKKMKGVISSDDLKSEEYNPPACSTDVNNKIKIIIRPWIRIDGSLNRKVLDRFLGTVLAYVMSNPGVSLRAIMDKFSPSITPVWTKDLVEILSEIGCITLITLAVVEKATLFSTSVTKISDEYTGLESDESVLIEAKVDAIATLGLFIGKKAYSKDFLSD